MHLTSAFMIGIDITIGSSWPFMTPTWSLSINFISSIQISWGDFAFNMLLSKFNISLKYLFQADFVNMPLQNHLQWCLLCELWDHWPVPHLFGIVALVTSNFKDVVDHLLILVKFLSFSSSSRRQHVLQVVLHEPIVQWHPINQSNLLFCAHSSRGTCNIEIGLC